MKYAARRRPAIGVWFIRSLPDEARLGPGNDWIVFPSFEEAKIFVTDQTIELLKGFMDDFERINLLEEIDVEPADEVLTSHARRRRI